MINVRAAANKLTQTVNPNIPVTWVRNMGWTTAEDGERSPTFIETSIKAQVQSAGTDSLQLADSLSLQGVFREVYIYEHVQAIVRVLGKGNDYLVFPIDYNGAPEKWKVVQVLEMWPGWAKVMVQLQDE